MKKLSFRYSLIIISIVLTILSGCTGDKMKTEKIVLPEINSVTAEKWQHLSQQKIYFGHQSVGFNIIDGIGDLMKTNPQIKLNIIETKNPADLDAPAFAHSPVGENTNPKSKCEAFAEAMNNGLGEKTDIAFFKFCYIDFFPDTNVDEVFETYKNTISSLQSKYPQTIFVHVTTPLTTQQTGLKAMIKKIIGKQVSGYADNIVREKFNEKLRGYYEGKEPVFDLALVESTNQAGFREGFVHKGETGYTLVPGYTYDGGHLNEKGRQAAAEQLLIVLSGL
jgi:hypothetical protein